MSKFLKQTEKNAKSIDEAKELALKELGASAEDVEFEIIEEGSKGFLGIGAKEAKVRAGIKDMSVFASKNFLSDIFNAMQLDVSIDAQNGDDGLEIDLSGDSMGIVIGKRGDTLDALQYLTSLIVNHESEDYIKVTIDTENYREKRKESLLALSERLASKVAKSGKKFTLEPMNPYERRVIHANLQDSTEVTTYSVGDEPYRKVVIAPKNPKQTSYKKPYKKPYSKSGYRVDGKKPYKNIDEMENDRLTNEEDI